MSKIARISYNSTGWKRPTGDAATIEGGTYNSDNGFGHEDWLFRDEWVLDGWRYSFIQGVNKSYDKLVREQLSFNVTLFTIEPDKRRRYVANIRDVECLDAQQASEALSAFKEQGWYDAMLKEISDAGGKPEALESMHWAAHVLNVRFRQENIKMFPADDYAEPGDRVFKLSRYILTEGAGAPGDRELGARNLPGIESFHRQPSGATICEPEHARMQVKLLDELRQEYPTALIRHELEFIDVVVRTETAVILYEIKSDQSSRTVIRLALGQILEYAIHPCRQHDLPVQLVIVGRNELIGNDKDYFEALKSTLNLPLQYRRLSISSASSTLPV